LFHFADSGDQLEDKGRELAQHFDTQGTPICVGGGVLAFTMLGVDYNAETGGIRFLILDPHYTGSEDCESLTLLFLLPVEFAGLGDDEHVPFMEEPYETRFVITMVPTLDLQTTRRFNISSLTMNTKTYACIGNSKAQPHKRILFPADLACGAWTVSTIQDPKKKNACSGIASVGWHDVSIFRKDSFYNLACPQRPQEI
jgi:hypothetical protein